MTFDLSGSWQVQLPATDRTYEISIPGTLDEAGIGMEDHIAAPWHPDATSGKMSTLFEDPRILTRLTRKHTYEGAVTFQRRISVENPEFAAFYAQVAGKKRIFLEVERARSLRLWINGKQLPEFCPGSLATPWVFEVTDQLTGQDEIRILSDNSYPGMPRDNIVNSSMATDETQTNWNGLLGWIRLRAENSTLIQRLAAYPKRKEGKRVLELLLSIAAAKESHGKIKILLENELLFEQELHLVKGENCLKISSLEVPKWVKSWDEAEGRLYSLSCELFGRREKEIQIGIRYFETIEGRLCLNGRKLFLRSEANCGVFPETGYAPMQVEDWKTILLTYRSYGVNMVRFHSYCPPEAAFVAADELGMLMQVELSHWNPRTAFETEESFAYYRKELLAILDQLANHPSFVMLTLGNELQAGKAGHERMTELLTEAKKKDSTRQYANGSNVNYGFDGCDPASDFFTASNYYEYDMRGTYSEMKGWINQTYPNTKANYEEAVREIRKGYQGAIFSFEVGQFEVLPDFRELQQFQGVLEPVNLKVIRDRAEKRGLLPKWDRMVEATGEMALQAYRAEVEAALRTKGYSGISLLGLQDFPGQGTALVGMLNSHLQPKPYDFAKPERFAAFFRESLPLLELAKYTYDSGEEVAGEIRIANYGKQELSGTLSMTLFEKQKDRQILVSRQTIRSIGKFPSGELSEKIPFVLKLQEVTEATELTLLCEVEGSDCKSSYQIYCYPKEELSCPEQVYETAYLDQTCMELIQKGGRIYLSPASTREQLPHSIQAQFTPDFWSVGTFPKQEGGMGQLIEEAHPIFKSFPTTFYATWQWHAMAGKRATIVPDRILPIITEMDSYAALKSMAKLFEVTCGKARILFSTMELQSLLHLPEGRALQRAIYRYLSSEEFAPTQEMTIEELKKITGGMAGNELSD